MIVTGTGFQRDYAYYPAKGLEGMIDDSVPHDVVTLSNNATSVDQVNSITIGTPVNNTDYSVTFYSTKLGIRPTTVTYTSSNLATASNIQTGLLEAINSNPQFSAHLKFDKNGSDISVTSRIHGSSGEFNLSVSGGGTGFAVSVETTPADPAIIPFGRVLWQRITDTNRNCRVIDGSLSDGVIRGFSVRTEVHESPYPGMPLGYLPKDEVNALTKGRMQIVPVSDMHPAGDIYIYISGENQGRLRGNADGSDTVKYTGTGIRIYEPVRAGEIGRVEVNLP